MKVNLIPILHFIAGLLVIAISLPLVKRKIRMNPLYGIRVDEAFKSGQKWSDINAYGGRMFFRWGVAIIFVSLIGMTLPLRYWLTYAYFSFLILMGGLGVVVALIMRFASGKK